MALGPHIAAKAGFYAENFDNKMIVRRPVSIAKYCCAGVSRIYGTGLKPFLAALRSGRIMFLIGTSPTYRKRRGRVIGSGMLLLFQPPELFTDLATGKPISAEVRRRIHARMLAYDAMPVHPASALWRSRDA
ncbi:YqcI/YcgG family protein [Paraburkholderia diazotrophica]|uniref:YqcI/YcgG family protein n=1 Tax=Paraburkholderia diazotrophica TaxID=667676 RepID=UPI00317B5C3E